MTDVLQCGEATEIECAAVDLAVHVVQRNPPGIHRHGSDPKTPQNTALHNQCKTDLQKTSQKTFNFRTVAKSCPIPLLITPNTEK